ncbi:MAG: GNAT family N-acetyltransferase [Acidobacteria bacterium]|nr:GNAT family N-acetyltransferase [Acidobacteriota bacterium]MBI3487420.1 GNAT family N-acetyltransferase [Acidobacteriota bacterium]
MRACGDSGVWRLEAGDPFPDWVARLDRTAFGDAWKTPALHERMWVIPELAFARWSCVQVAGEADLLRIAVDPAHRGSGLGRQLLEVCQQELADAGIDHLFLEVRVSNASAIRLYRACGWKPCGRRGGYYSDGEDADLFHFRAEG